MKRSMEEIEAMSRSEKTDMLIDLQLTMGIMQMQDTIVTEDGEQLSTATPATMQAINQLLKLAKVEKEIKGEEVDDSVAGDFREMLRNKQQHSRTKDINKELYDTNEEYRAAIDKREQ